MAQNIAAANGDKAMLTTAKMRRVSAYLADEALSVLAIARSNGDAHVVAICIRICDAGIYGKPVLVADAEAVRSFSV